VWFIHINKTSSDKVSQKQDFSDFVREGPPNENIPADILVELYEIIFDATDGMLK